MKISLYKLLLGVVAVFGLSAIGCDDQVTMSDVESARDNVQEEAEDVREAEREAREEIADEQADVDEINREEREEITEEREDLAEAQAEAAEVEQEFVNQEQRNDFIEQHRTALNDADARLDTLETDAGNIEDDAAQTARENEVGTVRDLYDDANDKFGELDATDEDNWKTEHAAFAAAFQRLQEGLNKLGRAATTTIDPAAPDPVTVP
jgi:chromosome segregation ATPase